MIIAAMAQQARTFNPRRLAIVSAIVLAIGGWLIHEARTLETTDEATFETAVTVHELFNLVEALVWLGVGVVLIWKFRRGRRRDLPKICAGVAFLFFGVSDLIEIQTGSWFEPTWLLVWNVTCVVSLAGCFAWHWALNRKRSAS